MDKKFFILLFIILFISLVVFIIFISSSSNDELNDIDNGTFDINQNMDKLLGTWNDIFYITDDDSSGTWTFNSNSSIKIEISGYTYNDVFQKKIEWYYYKIQNNQICIKFNLSGSYICYDYFFGKSYNHITLTSDTSSSDRSIIYLNK